MKVLDDLNILIIGNVPHVNDLLSNSSSLTKELIIEGISKSGIMRICSPSGDNPYNIVAIGVKSDTIIRRVSDKYVNIETDASFDYCVKKADIIADDTLALFTMNIEDKWDSDKRVDLLHFPKRPSNKYLIAITDFGIDVSALEPDW